MKTVWTRTTYLEMCSPNQVEPVPPDSTIEVRRLVKPSLEFYRMLYREVGQQWGWIDRVLMDEDELEEIITDDRVEIHLLQVEGQTAGFSELDHRTETPEQGIELAYFGLFPAFIGRGLGKFFIQWTIHRAWSLGPTRLWLHTCDLDHPAALPNYLKAGFSVYDEKYIEQPIR